MNSTKHFGTSICLLALLSACAMPLSQEASAKKLPIAAPASGSEVAELFFSADKKYETPTGAILKGDPLVCKNGSLTRVNSDTSVTDHITVKAGEEIAVTSVVSWVANGFRLVCSSLVAFTPEKDGKYVVVNERLNGKGMSGFLTPPAQQTCGVYVYKETPTGFSPIETRKVNKGQCRGPEA